MECAPRDAGQLNLRIGITNDKTTHYSPGLGPCCSAGLSPDGGAWPSRRPLRRPLARTVAAFLAVDARQPLRPILRKYSRTSLVTRTARSTGFGYLSNGARDHLSIPRVPWS